jgi:hypothetical protein
MHFKFLFIIIFRFVTLYSQRINYNIIKTKNYLTKKSLLGYNIYI